MAKEVNPNETTRAKAYELWMSAPNPMVTVFKTLDVTHLKNVSKKQHLKFNMLLSYAIGKAAVSIGEFYLLPLGNKLFSYDSLAVSVTVQNKDGEVCSCDIACSDGFEAFCRDYSEFTAQVAENGKDRDLSADHMVIGTSAVLDTELDGVVGMNSGIWNNPFLFWSRYKKRWFRYYLPVSFQFHHTQMDGSHAARFLQNLQDEINQLI